MPVWTKEQEEAIYEKGKNIIVSAGAGSGKTAVLSERVLKHLQNGIDASNLLILTFTNAAAKEMKQRIKNKVLKDDNIKQQIDKIEIADITTFDAYALSILKKYGYLIDIPKDISIIDSGIINIAKKRILRQIMDELYEEGDLLFLDTVQKFSKKNDNDIFNGILTIDSKLDNIYDKKSYLEKYIDCFYHKENIKSVLTQYTYMLQNIIDSIKNHLFNLSYYTSKQYISKLTDTLNPLFKAKTIKEIQDALTIRLNNLPKNSDNIAIAIKQEISKMIKELKELTKEDEKSLTDHLEYTRSDASVIVNILLELNKRVDDFKDKHNSYEFSDIMKKAIYIFDKFPFVKEELKNKYSEILIDEYQDTNDIQDLFISYLQNNNVYMVGDIKQSIYRFRNANPKLFKEKYQSYASGHDGYKIDLNKNFRSRREVADNVNFIFNLIMNSQIGGADYFESHQMVFGNNNYDNVTSSDYKMQLYDYKIPNDFKFTREEIEIFIIASDIKEKIKNKYKVMDKDTLLERDVNYSDFAILIDKSKNFDLYKKVFEYLNIPLTIYKDQTISSSDDILIIKNLYSIVVSIYKKEDFTYPFMSILRSYLYNMEDDKIFDIITNKTFKDTELYKKCLEIAKCLDELNNYEVYNMLIDKFDFYEKIITVGDVDKHITTLDSILKAVNSSLEFGYTPIEFLDYLNEMESNKFEINLSLNKENNNSVKIMTIHASKGLEYYICYFSGLTNEFNLKDLKDKFNYFKDFGILLPYNFFGIKSTMLKELIKRQYIKEEISEKIRLFYVALTRAREKMILITDLSLNLLSFKLGTVINDEVRMKYKSFNDMLCSIYDRLGPYMNCIDINKLYMTKGYNLSRKKNYRESLISNQTISVEEYNPDYSLTNSDRFSKKTNSLYTKEETENITLGLRMHLLFEQTDLLNPDYSVLDDKQAKIVKTFLSTGILSNAINIYKEYEFIYEEDKTYHGFIDLLIEYENSFSIVDYKLQNIKDKAYLKQLNGYKKYIESITGKKTDIYLYSILEGKLVKL